MSYRTSDEIDKAGRPYHEHFLRSSDVSAMLEISPDGPAYSSKRLQSVVGDWLVNKKGESMGLECKTEEHAVNKAGVANFYLETWGHRGNGNLGWMYTNEADMLTYFFLDTRELWFIRDFRALRKWFFEPLPGRSAADLAKKYPGREFLNQGLHRYDTLQEAQSKKHGGDGWGRLIKRAELASILEITRWRIDLDAPPKRLDIGGASSD